MKYFYPEDLPITGHKDEIIETILNHQVVIISGDTGSGKTTQLPKMCFEAFGDRDLLIGCTQPRRIAASTVADRVTEELGGSDLVGYKIRFHDHTTEKTRIKFMTDGVLLAESRQDRLLSRYGVIIIDEAHERSLNIDCLLGYIRQILPKRPDLKVIITSATIDTESFARHFNNAPIIAVSGRNYPVTVQYEPPTDEDGEDKETTVEHCVSVTSQLFYSNRSGDILIFLPTEREIRECCKLLSAKIVEANVLPLFGRLSVVDQKRIFRSSKKVKIVVATNVAETSITVPGIRYVIDSGLARISHYNVRAKTTALPISKISQASCEQRKGRCGRVGAGHCIRLYSEDDFLNREEYTLPEVKRSNLAEVILQMISLGLGNPEQFPFIDPPFKNAINEGYKLLRELGAIVGKSTLTKTGKLMAALPIDPCISRILIEAKSNNCITEIKIICAVLAIQDPRIRPDEQEKQADLAHKTFAHPHSDFMVLLNIWNSYHLDESQQKSWSKLKKFCKANFLSFQRMREWFDLHNQLGRILTSHKDFDNNTVAASYEQIHKSLLAGFLRNLAMKKQGKIYKGAYNKELMIFPGSHQFLRGGQWLMAASFIETNRLYAFTVATIEPEWVEMVGQQLCKYSWASPHYQKKSGQVVATETVSLFGLPLFSGRNVDFGAKSVANQKEARDIFINEALVPGKINGSYLFLNQNLTLLSKWQQAEEKLRTRNIVADPYTMYTFYDKNLPTHVYDQRSLNRWLKKHKNHQTSLQMGIDDILLRQPEEKELVDFPPFCLLGQIKIHLDYVFAPGSPQDGVTFKLPIDFASIANPAQFEWLVPGLLQEKITFLLKGLPKTLRKKLVPVSDSVDLLLDSMDYRKGSLYSSLEKAILQHFKLLIQKSDWPRPLPSHLEPHFLIQNSKGEKVIMGRHLHKLLDTDKAEEMDQAKPKLSSSDQQIVKTWQDSEHMSWNFNGLPRLLPTYSALGDVTGYIYPCLEVVPERACLRLVFERNRKNSEKLNKAGNLYLVKLLFPQQLRSLKKYCKTALSGPSIAILSSLGLSNKVVIEKLIDYIVLNIIRDVPGEIFSEKEYLNIETEINNQNIFSTGQRYCDDILALFRKRYALQRSISNVFEKAKRARALVAPQMQKEFDDNLSQVLPVAFFTKNSVTNLENIGRQLQSLDIRLERFTANPDKDRKKSEQLLPFQKNLTQLVSQQDGMSKEAIDQIEIYKEMVEEYRISLFSPEIKTKMTVSPKKLEKQWNATRAMC